MVGAGPLTCSAAMVTAWTWSSSILMGRPLICGTKPTSSRLTATITSRRSRPQQRVGGQFVDAVTSSTAHIVVPTLHGRTSNNEIGPGPEDAYRPLDHVFSPGSIQAENLVVFCCDQWQDREQWRQIAPSSRIVLRDGVTSGVVTVVRHVLGQPRNLPRGWQEARSPHPGLG